MDGSTSIGVSHAPEFVAFAAATISAEVRSLDLKRAALVRVVGIEAMIDAAAVIAGFDGITRIADATGIPLEPSKAEQTADLRASLHIDEFASAKS